MLRYKAATHKAKQVDQLLQRDRATA